MAPYQNYQRNVSPAGTLEHRLTIVEMWIMHLRDEQKDTTAAINAFRGMAFKIILAIAGSAVLLLINIALLGKLPS